MSANNQTLQLMREHEVVHKKMYKDGRQWVVAAMGTLAMGAGVVGMNAAPTAVHADTTTATPAVTTTAPGAVATTTTVTPAPAPAQTAPVANVTPTAPTPAPAQSAPVTPAAPTVSAVPSAAPVQSAPATSVSTAPSVSSVANDQSTVVDPMTSIAGMPAVGDASAHQSATPSRTPQSNVTVNEGSSTLQGPQDAGSITPLTPTINSANTIVASEFSSQHNIFEDAGGTLNQGSTITIPVTSENASSALSALNVDQSSQIANIEAAASAVNSLKSLADTAQSVADGLGGSVKLLDPLDVSSMTPDQITSAVASQGKFLAETLRDNQSIASAINANVEAVKSLGGNFVPGSAIDTTGMSRVDIRDLMNSQVAMIEATGSAAQDIASTVDLWSQDITDFGGTLTQGGVINTADGMTSQQVQKAEDLQKEHIAAVGIGDDVISNAIATDVDEITAAGAVYKPGSMIDVTKMSTKDIKALIKGQVAMIQAVVKADRQAANVLNQYQKLIEANGGALKVVNVNAADNMTPEGVMKDQATNASQVATVASADVQATSLASSAKDAIKSVGGIFEVGSMIDATNMTASELASLVAVQSATISATVKADQDVTKAVSDASDTISNVGGTLMQGSMVNTADNMEASDVLSAASQDVKNISVAVSGDTEIASMIASAKPAIESVHGHLTTGSSIDVSTMTIDDVANLMSNQARMLSATLSADQSVLSDVAANSGAYASAGGHLVEGSIINTADNMNASDVASLVFSNHAVIAAGASANTEVASLKDQANSIFAKTGGKLTLAKPIDATSMTAEEIQDAQTTQSMMLSAVIAADETVSNAVVSATDPITKIGGTIKQSGIINTADQMTSDDVTSDAESMGKQLDRVASADTTISNVVASASTALGKVGAKLAAGSGTVDVTNWDAATIDSFVNQQSAMLSATASANDRMGALEAQYSDAIAKAGATMTANGMINTADNMTGQALSDTAEHEAQIMTALGVADTKLNDLQASANDASKPFGGMIVTGAPKDMTSAEANEIQDLYQSQADMISAVASGNVVLSNAAAVASGVVTPLGGKVVAGPVQDVTSLGADALTSLINSQVAQIQAVTNGDNALLNTVNSVKGAIEGVKGQLTQNAPVNVSDQNPEQIAQMLKDQETLVAAAGQADSDLLTAINGAQAALKTNGGALTIGPATDVSKMTPLDIQTAMQKQVEAINALTTNVTALNNAQQTAAQAIAAMGGKIAQGTAVDVTNLSADEIATKVQAEVALLQAMTTGANDLTNVQATTQAQIKAANGTITAGTTVDTVGMTTDQIQAEVAKQVANAQQIAAADGLMNDALTAAKQHIAAAGGTIQYTDAVSGERMSSEAIASYAQGQINAVSTAAANDQVLIDAVHTNQSAFTHNGGAIVAGSMIDVTSETVGDIETAVTNQTAALSMVLDGVNHLNSNVDRYASDVVQGSAQDFTERNKSDVSSFVASQGTAMGRANDINGIVDKYVGDLKAYNVTATVTEKVVKTQEELEAIAKANADADAAATDAGIKNGSSTVNFTKVKYQYSGLSFTYNPLSIKMTGLSATLHGLMNSGTVTPFTMTATPDSVSYTPYELNGGFAPMKYTTTPMSMTYQNFESDGSGINVLSDQGTINSAFTGYAPLSVTYQTFDSDADLVPEGDTVTGLAPLDVSYLGFESDGAKVPVGDNFTGISPLMTTYNLYESDGTKVPVGDRFTGVVSYGTGANVYSLDGTTVLDGDKFTGVAPLGLQYFGYTSDGSKVGQGHQNTGIAALDTAYQPLSTSFHYYQDVADNGQAGQDSQAPTSDGATTDTPAPDQSASQAPTSDGVGQVTPNGTDDTTGNSQAPMTDDQVGSTDLAGQSAGTDVMAPLGTGTGAGALNAAPAMLGGATGDAGMAPLAVAGDAGVAPAGAVAGGNADAAALPQTGNAQDGSQLALLGLAMLAMSLTAGFGVTLKRQK